jgi:hypothetical protein
LATPCVIPGWHLGSTLLLLLLLLLHASCILLHPSWLDRLLELLLAHQYSRIHFILLLPGSC